MTACSGDISVTATLNNGAYYKKKIHGEILTAGTLVISI